MHKSKKVHGLYTQSYINARHGNLSDTDMYNTFNMGIGMIMVVKDGDQQKVSKQLESIDEKGYIIGSVIEGEKGVSLC